jgi:methionine sulfoxide reductase catalytic subunit
MSTIDFEPKFKAAHDFIDFKDWTPTQWGIFPEFRFAGRYWKASWLLLPAILIGLLQFVGSVWFLETAYGQEFVRTYPGTVSMAVIDAHGFPWWLRLSHLLNLLLMVIIIRSGIQILADHPRLYWDRDSTPGSEWFRFQIPVPMNRVWMAKDDAVTIPGWLGIPGGRHTVGPARWLHFSCDLFWMVNGLAFVILLFVSEQWQRLIPRTWEVIPNAISTAIQYGALRMPLEDGWVRYNALQQLVYGFTVFVAAPVAILAGLAQAPAIGNRFARISKYFNRQAARSVHFLILCYFIFYIATHVTMVFLTGFKKNFNHIVMNSPADTWTGFVIGAVVLATIAVLWISASPLTRKHARELQKGGAFLVGWMKSLMEWWDPTVQYTGKDISPFFWPNGKLPVSPEYVALKADGFRDFKLHVYGLCENPCDIPFPELKAIGKQEQITMQYCIQGWSGVAKWGGVPMREILAIARPRPEAKYAVFYSFGEGGEGGIFYDVHKMENMRHELTMLAYEMNGEVLPELHGSPLRLRCENELGFKNIKWVRAVEFVEDFRHIGSGHGGYNEDVEFYGYRMPI